MIKCNIDASAALELVQRQLPAAVPYVKATLLTNAAQGVQGAIKKQLPVSFDRPTPFTVRSVCCRAERYWLDGRRTAYPPVLRWQPEWDALADAVVPAAPDSTTIGAHVDSETARHYGYVKDWPAAHWQSLVARFPAGAGVRWLLFGHARGVPFDQENVIDLRGRTDLLSLLAVVRTRCRILVAPDSGILTLAYYLEGDRRLDVISLWSDPRQGVLKQGCPSPNPKLAHTVLRGRDEDVRNISVDTVASAIGAALPALPPPPRLSHASAH